MTTRVLHWFRRDLRTLDNRALHAGALAARDGVVGVYVICPGEWNDHDDAPVKVEFWLRNLRELREDLARLNIPLLVVHADSARDIPKRLDEVAAAARCDALFFNREYEVDERRRDEAVVALFEERGRTVALYDDRCIVPPGLVRTKEGRFYTVFTPFQNRVFEAMETHDWAPLGVPKAQPRIEIESDDVPRAIEGFGSSVDPDLWPAGQRAAAERLSGFIEHRSGSYGTARDFPGLEGTSTLSPYLNSGVISPRRCLHAAIEADGGAIRIGKRYQGEPSGLGKWISELVWREFYIHITHNFPRISMGQGFKPVDRAIPWRDAPEDFGAWCEGRTGFPFVDAAMRQLCATGWMHNRARMVVAMFLTKDLLVDWRWGERYFMRHLIDGDLGSNNGGWQWSASTGTDAAPYFRVYNPTTQGKRYDPEGEYIRRWVPELAGVEGRAIFDPSRASALWRAVDGYPEPIVDHRAARDRAIEVFREAKGGAVGAA